MEHIRQSWPNDLIFGMIGPYDGLIKKPLQKLGSGPFVQERNSRKLKMEKFQKFRQIQKLFRFEFLT